MWATVPLHTVPPTREEEEGELKECAVCKVGYSWLERWWLRGRDYPRKDEGALTWSSIVIRRGVERRSPSEEEGAAPCVVARVKKVGRRPLIGRPL